MKKTYFFLCLLTAFGISVKTQAQTDPGTANLTHQWTFDDGTAKDAVGTADGTLQGAATFSGKALNTSAGGYLTLPGSAIGVNGYTALTAEAWFTSSSGVNTGCPMLAYFGNTTGSYGTDYLFFSPSNCGRLRSAMSCGNTSAPWEAETGVNGTAAIDDGKLHHLVTTVDATTLTYYVDGVSVGAVTLSAANTLSALSTQYVYLCKGGYTGDPTWKGLIHKFSMYNKALSPDEVLYLFQKGAEAQAVVNATVSSMVFDSSYPAQVFSVSSANLTSPVTVTAPAGVVLMDVSGNIITSIAANQTDFQVTAVYDGTTAVDGNVVLSSGSTSVTIPVKSADDSKCFVKLYDNDVNKNLINDPGMNSLANFQGWGAKGVSTIISDPANVYCGASSISIGNGTSTGSGSLDILNGVSTLLKPNTSYRVKVMIKTIGGTFHLGVDAGPNVEFPIDTQGEWMVLDKVFTTGSSVGANMYINNWACTGLIAYVDNYELYEYTEPIITASASSFAFDPEFKAGSFTVTSQNLTSEVLVAAPAGITLSSEILPVISAAEPVTVTWDGVTPVNGYITLTSGTTVVKIPVKTIATSNTSCYTPLYTDKTNIIPDPYLNDASKFGGWGAKSFVNIIETPDSVYCGSHSGLINGSGSMDVVLTGLLQNNTSYVAKAMVKTWGTFQMGVYGIDDVNTADVVDTINTKGAWMPMTFHFTTANLKTAYGLFFNDSKLSGTRGYIDNWELYQADYNAVAQVSNNNSKVYLNNNDIVTEFELNQVSKVEISVYNVQGALISVDRFNGNSGKNYKTLSAKISSGVYFVKLSIDGKSNYTKLIK